MVLKVEPIEPLNQSITSMTVYVLHGQDIEVLLLDGLDEDLKVLISYGPEV